MTLLKSVATPICPILKLREWELNPHELLVMSQPTVLWYEHPAIIFFIKKQVTMPPRISSTATCKRKKRYEKHEKSLTM